MTDRTTRAEPLATLTAKTGHSLVVPWITKYNGTGGVQAVTEPIDTIPCKDRFGLAMASLISTMRDLAVVDIGFRMLDDVELARTEGLFRRLRTDGHQGRPRAADRQLGLALGGRAAEGDLETVSREGVGSG